MLSRNLTKQSLSITTSGEKQKCDNRRQQISSERTVLLAPGSISGCFPAVFFNIFLFADP